ncbi:MAG: AAA family ATPase, partial [Fervidobacterium sp.]|nr:AAA family ATPase [Fervidobacterium sp.]
MKNLPIGISDFRKMIEEGYIYVDKTKYVYEMIRDSEYIFLSRPRRFGKSLLVSVLEYLFKGEKGLFIDTWIYDKWDWESFPVVRLDMNRLNTEDTDLFKQSLDDEICFLAQQYNINLKRNTYDGRFSELIEDLYYKYNKQVVLLIDEYEKPILDHISDKDKAKQMRDILRQVYTKIKSLDKYLRFVFLTGITKYTKAGVFSTLNNLADISLHEDF